MVTAPGFADRAQAAALSWLIRAVQALPPEACLQHRRVSGALHWALAAGIPRGRRQFAPGHAGAGPGHPQAHRPRRVGQSWPHGRRTAAPGQLPPHRIRPRLGAGGRGAPGAAAGKRPAGAVLLRPYRQLGAYPAHRGQPGREGGRRLPRRQQRRRRPRDPVAAPDGARPRGVDVPQRVPRAPAPPCCICAKAARWACWWTRR